MTVRASGTIVLAVAVAVGGWWWFEDALTDTRDVQVLLTGFLVLLLVPSVVGQVRRPADSLPPALAVTAFAFVVGYFRLLPQPWVATVGAFVWLSAPLCFLWLAGHAQLGIVRVRAMAAWGVPAALALASVLVSGPRPSDRSTGAVRAATWVTGGIGDDELPVVRQPNPLAWLRDDVAPVVLWSVWCTWLVMVLVWTWRRSARGSDGRPSVHVALAVVALGILATASAAWPDRVVPDGSSLLRDRWYTVPIVLVPAMVAAAAGAVAVMSEIVQPRLRHASRRRMEIEGGWSPSELRTRLREVLGDPTVRLVMADPDRPGAWLDEGGQETQLPESAHRAATIVERSGGPIAGIEYEPSTAEQSQLVDLAAMSVGFALESVRLAAVAAREAAAARAAATQVLVAAEIARDGLRRSVEAGPERELAAVGELLKERPLPLEDIHAGLRRATAAVREVSRALAEESPPGASPLDSVEVER